MDLTKYFGLNILDTLSLLRKNENVVTYSKVEADEFLQVPEGGYYLQSKNRSGKISNIRIFFENHDGFFPSKDDHRGKYAGVNCFSDIEKILGLPAKEIRPIKIPGAPPSLPGKQYLDGNFIVSAFAEDGVNIVFIHIKTQ